MARFDLTEPGAAPQLRHEFFVDPPQASHVTPANPLEPKTLIDVVDAALRANDIRSARTQVSEAGSRADGPPLQSVELAKAHIAAATGDFLAAQAILVMALEKVPADQKLRVFLSEVMMASGRATDVRSVLAHLSPKTPAKPTAQACD